MRKVEGGSEMRMLFECIGIVMKRRQLSRILQEEFSQMVRKRCVIKVIKTGPEDLVCANF